MSFLLYLFHINLNYLKTWLNVVVSHETSQLHRTGYCPPSVVLNPRQGHLLVLLESEESASLIRLAVLRVQASLDKRQSSHSLLRRRAKAPAPQATKDGRYKSGGTTWAFLIQHHVQYTRVHLGLSQSGAFLVLGLHLRNTLVSFFPTNIPVE